MDRLRLLAVDPDDLAVLSATCQDAVVHPKDCVHRGRQKQFVMEFNRFVWETAQKRRFALFSKPSYERRRAVLHFDRVSEVKSVGFDGQDSDAVLVLLAIRFTPSLEPSGTIDLVFAGAAMIRLTVEVIEAQLTDIGGAWSTKFKPDHDRDPA